ncbi:microsomal glutathione S-transferase 1 [Orussus abietinus]|uniref:microsomal glutathione S-transferase 1 n=1 Tax=Orussus abietinus TaxID=222816 RepID=UPI000625D421|nr:microsomal glutathione S-transferase 1 [Orussus abietinus]
MLNSSSQNTEIYRTYFWWTGVLLLKLLLMIPLTGIQRFRKQVYISPEDVAFLSFLPRAKLLHSDPDVERVRRAHLNDLENILPWILCTWLWLTTSPSPLLAELLIKTFAICRIAHTVVYAIVPFPQPTRFLVFIVAHLITVYQAISTVCYYF